MHCRAILLLFLVQSIASAQSPSVIKVNGWVGGIAFSPDSRWLAAASSDSSVRLFDVAEKQELRSLKGHGDIVSAVAFSPNAQWLVSTSYDGTARVWETASGRLTHMLTGHRGVVGAAAFSPDGKMLATGGIDGTIRLWDPTSGQMLQTMHHLSWVNALAFSPSGQLASGSSD